MKDTTDAVQREYAKKIMERSPEERLKMGTRMFTMARKLYLSGLDDDLTEDQRREKLREFLYGTKSLD